MTKGFLCELLCFLANAWEKRKAQQLEYPASVPGTSLKFRPGGGVGET